MKRGGDRKTSKWGSGLSVPISFLLLALGGSFWKVKHEWQDLVAVQRDRRGAQATLAQAEEILATRDHELKTSVEELADLKLQNENKEQEVTVIKAEILRYKDECDVRRTAVKEKHLREIEDVVFEAKTKVAMELQSSRLKEHANHEARETVLDTVNQRHRLLVEQVRELEKSLAQVEMDRLLFRLLGNTSQPYVQAFFERLRKGAFNEPITMNLQTVYSSQAMAHGRSGLWSVDNSGERASLGSVPPVLPEVLPREDALGPHYPRGGAWHSCAVVGTSGLLLHYNLGAEIDQHTAVFRMNEAPIKGFETHVGRRTTIRLVEDQYHALARSQPSKQMVLQQIKTKATLQEFIDFKSTPESMNLYYLAPDLELHVARYLKKGPVTWGLFTVFLAAQKCRKITLYGFAAHHRGHVQYRYWDHEEPKVMMRSSVGSAYDSDINDMGMLSEFVHQSNGLHTMAVPCVSSYHCMSPCENCTSVPLSQGGRCSCNSPLPVPARGYCRDHLTPTNCFRKCPGGKFQCPGGYDQASCEKLGVKNSEPIVGESC
eukprot:CAMPEP_0196583566 /NCGR_PEP_ID=MMETSP1081-20130531/43905_1 /TAXON_ID=36882 /ORGANISM="Pyramimonas amylifera, Strain CCMP720" /LENGTH=544 /DNA_ID=CAMNT_0041904497 /DNA_START=125 /DNA_END=1759 /DNA_ORIENTATION=-